MSLLRQRGYGSKSNHQDMDPRIRSMFPLTRVPVRVLFFDPQSCQKPGFLNGANGFRNHPQYVGFRLYLGARRKSGKHRPVCVSTSFSLP